MRPFLLLALPLLLVSTLFAGDTIPLQKRAEIHPLVGIWEFNEGDQDEGTSLALIVQQGDGFLVQMTRPGGKTINGIGSFGNAIWDFDVALTDSTGAAALAKVHLSTDWKTLNGWWMNAKGQKQELTLRRLSDWPLVKPRAGASTFSGYERGLGCADLKRSSETSNPGTSSNRSGTGSSTPDTKTAASQNWSRAAGDSVTCTSPVSRLTTSVPTGNVLFQLRAVSSSAIRSRPRL